MERLKNFFKLIIWTQSKNSGIEEAAKELKEIYEAVGKKKVFFIAHSRGGVVARYAIQKYRLSPLAIVCLSVPHRGSNLATLILKYKKILTLFYPRLRRYFRAIMELTPDSPFITSLNSPSSLAKEVSVLHIDFCGSNTHYFRFLGIDFLETIERVFKPQNLPEIRRGEGDGFVSLKSARSPLTEEENFYVFPTNHLNILVDRGIQDSVVTLLSRHL